MNPLVEKFERDIPPWVGGIKETAAQKITNLNLVQDCARGDDEALYKLILGFWPFVRDFPDHISGATKSMARGKYLSNVQKLHLRGLLAEVSGLLPDIRRDEERHRDLWIKTASVLSISLPELTTIKKVTPEMKFLLTLTEEETHPSEKLVQFSTVEIVAEALSKTVLASGMFREKLGPKGIEWFRVHAEHHGEETHETLTLKLAFAFLEHPIPEEIDRIVQKMTDAFVCVANTCASIRTHITA